MTCSTTRPAHQSVPRTPTDPLPCRHIISSSWPTRASAYSQLVKLQAAHSAGRLTAQKPPHSPLPTSRTCKRLELSDATQNRPGGELVLAGVAPAGSTHGRPERPSPPSRM